MTRAVCVRCGAIRPGWEGPCPSCGHRPEGEGVLVAWLLSDAHLSAEGMEAAAQRIQRGEPVRASDRMLETARVALGRHASKDPGLTRTQRLGLLSLSLLVTALPAMVLWWWWREDRPRSAVQALLIGLPAGVLSWGLILWQWWLTVRPG